MSELVTGTDVTDQHIIEAMQVEIDRLTEQLAAVRAALNNHECLCSCREDCTCYEETMDNITAAIGEKGQ